MTIDLVMPDRLNRTQMKAFTKIVSEGTAAACCLASPSGAQRADSLSRGSQELARGARLLRRKRYPEAEKQAHQISPEQKVDCVGTTTSETTGRVQKYVTGVFSPLPLKVRN